MNTQDNLNLDVEYLEVVTCTYSELCKIKKPTNGRLYHTSDTNEFYFDWNNKRHKLSVFTTDKSESSDVVKKSELGAWLKKNNYITNLSLTDALVDVIGSPIENIITKQALENYSKNHLLTKEELNLLNEPLNLIDDIKTLKGTNKTLFSYCERLANQINEVRVIANDKISSGELNTRLNEYIKSLWQIHYTFQKILLVSCILMRKNLLKNLKGMLQTNNLQKV
jgi:Ca2+-binding EF-hand superfamily protein